MPEVAIHPPRALQALDPSVDLPEIPGRSVLYDFCLMPYGLDRPTEGQLAAESLLRRTWQLAGVLEPASAIAEHLKARLGPRCTVWGAKRDPVTGKWSWELYFYKRDHTPPDLSPALVAACLGPLGAPPTVRVALLPPADMAWTFFSIGLKAEDLLHGGEVALRLYVEGRDLSWAVKPEGLELENHYAVFDTRGQLTEFVQKLRTSVHLPRHPLAVARVVPPPMHRCWRIWLASKRTCDTIYAQRVETGDLLVLLRHFGWPADVTDWLHERLDLLEHVRWDLSHDFQRLPASTDPREPPVRIVKGACYATL